MSKNRDVEAFRKAIAHGPCKNLRLDQVVTLFELCQQVIKHPPGKFEPEHDEPVSPSGSDRLPEDTDHLVNGGPTPKTLMGPNTKSKKTQWIVFGLIVIVGLLGI